MWAALSAFLIVKQSFLQEWVAVSLNQKEDLSSPISVLEGSMKKFILNNRILEEHPECSLTVSVTPCSPLNHRTDSRIAKLDPNMEYFL